MSTKKTITILKDGKNYGVSWYLGTDAASIEKAICTALQLDTSFPLQLTDEQNDTVAISDALPDGLTLTFGTQATSQLIQPKGPKPEPGIGNAKDLMSKNGEIAAMRALTDTYGSMVLIQLPNYNMYICSDADVLQDMLKRTDEFQKIIPPPTMGLGNLRAYTTGDGLFTSSDSDEMWQIAHRILLPGFGVPAIQQYYGRMVEVGD